MNSTNKPTAKPKASHPWRQYNSGWLNKDTSFKFKSPLIGGVHSKQGKSPC